MRWWKCKCSCFLIHLHACVSQIPLLPMAPPKRPSICPLPPPRFSLPRPPSFAAPPTLLSFMIERVGRPFTFSSSSVIWEYDLSIILLFLLLHHFLKTSVLDFDSKKGDKREKKLEIMGKNQKGWPAVIKHI